MNIKTSKRMTSLLLAGAIFTISSCSVSDSYVIDENDNPFLGMPIQYVEEETKEEPVINNPVEVDTNSLEYNTRFVDYAYAINSTTIYSNDNVKLGTFAKGRYFRLLSATADYCTIDYYGEIGYVSRKDLYLTVRRDMDAEIILKGYLPTAGKLYKDYDLSEEVAELEKLEFVEIYKELDNCYLVATIDYVGYVSKEDVVLLNGTLVVIDRSNQEMRLYEDNNVTVKTPVVTGTKDTSRESDLGLFQIHTMAKNLYIIPNYWVDCVAYYNGGEGIHTAEWRENFEFGGDTFEWNGSHGCINTPHDAAMQIYDTLEKGDKVLVKE